MAIESLTRRSNIDGRDRVVTVAYPALRAEHSHITHDRDEALVSIREPRSIAHRSVHRSDRTAMRCECSVNSMSDHSVLSSCATDRSIDGRSWAPTAKIANDGSSEFPGRSMVERQDVVQGWCRE